TPHPVVPTLYRLASLPILPRPPPSALLPYTTLFRSNRGDEGVEIGRTTHSSELPALGEFGGHRDGIRGLAASVEIQDGVIDHLRSEEHTSELQSRFDLVCRLLLEKRKNYRHDSHACV